MKLIQKKYIDKKITKKKISLMSLNINVYLYSFLI